MKAKTKATFIIVVLSLVLLAWAPWLSEDYVRTKIKSNNDFIQKHDPYYIPLDSEIHVTWFPFGRWVTTYESGWIITFYGGVSPNF